MVNTSAVTLATRPRIATAYFKHVMILRLLFDRENSTILPFNFFQLCFYKINLRKTK